jgi:hypothetical protein
MFHPCVEIAGVLVERLLTSSNDEENGNSWQEAQLFRQLSENLSNDEQSHCLKIISTILDKRISYF